MKKYLQQLYEGIFTNNPVLVQLIGMCPTLATTTSLNNGIGMGLAATAVLICSNAVISLLRKFIPLIVVNCIILARAEAFASKNKVLPSIVDGLAMGLGFTFALCILSSIREILGNGTIAGVSLFGENYEPMIMMILPAGGFLTLGCVIALFQKILKKGE